MAAKKKQQRIARDKAHITDRIGRAATRSTEEQSTDDQYPSFRFTHADPNKYCLDKWTSRELPSLIKTWQKMERMTWAQIRTSGGHRENSGGIGWKPIDRARLPAFPSSIVEDDVEIHEVRVTQKMRLFGYRAGAIFYIVWFDREHEICPE